MSAAISPVFSVTIQCYDSSEAKCADFLLKNHLLLLLLLSSKTQNVTWYEHYMILRTTKI